MNDWTTLETLQIKQLEEEVKYLKIKQGQQHKDLHKLMREINIIHTIMKNDNK